MTYSQYDEDDIVDRLLDFPHVGCIVDIGAGDGMEISNSRLFRERGWHTILWEADGQTHWDALLQLQRDWPYCEVTIGRVSPQSINAAVLSSTDVVSIDIDGDDIFLLEALDRRPDVIVIEHNPTMPYHLDVSPARPGLRIGASVAALTRVAETKGYGLAAVTHCNAIFQAGVESIPMPEYRPAYVVATDYFRGRPLVLGEAPWGVAFGEPFPGEDVIIR